MVAGTSVRKEYTIYLDGGRYVVIQAEELKVEPIWEEGKVTTRKMLRLFDGHQVAEFDTANVIGWSEGNNPLKS
jgi:hypothetical protein